MSVPCGISRYMFWLRGRSGPRKTAQSVFLISRSSPVLPLLSYNTRPGLTTSAIIKSRTFATWHRASYVRGSRTRTSCPAWSATRLWAKIAPALFLMVIITGIPLALVYMVIYNKLSSRSKLYSLLVATTQKKQKKSLSSLYDRLGTSQFRVLVLEPGSGEEDVQCKLISLDFRNSPKYEALSYAWGDPTRSHSIICNGRRIIIPANLHTALWHLRLQDQPRILWVDAICIDQEDLDERGRQVGIMKNIFSGASQVTVWVGEETPEVQESFGILKKLASREVYKPEFILRLRSEWTRDGFDFSRVTTSLPLDLVDWKPLVKLFERPWFRRVWVIQEVAHASNVMVVCGKQTLDWRLLAIVVRDLQHSGIVAEVFTREAQASAHSVIEMESTRKDLHYQHSRSLLSVLLATAASNCSDLRDKIFAVLSLADAQGIQPDYRASVSEVYQLFASWSINTNGTIDVLSCATPSKNEAMNELERLPSWVPDWTRIHNPYPFVRYSSRLPFKAAGTWTQENSSSMVNQNTLVLQAQPIDVVSAVGETHIFSKTPYHNRSSREVSRSLSTTRDWILECETLAFQDRSETREKRLEEFYRTMICGLTGAGNAASSAYQKQFEQYRNFLDKVIATCRDSPLDERHDRSWRSIYSKEVAAIESSIYMWSSRRRFGVTESGKLTFLPKDAKVGDVVFVVKGAKVPYLLRNGVDGDFTAIGEVYLDGAMYGEVVDEAAFDEYKVK